MSEKNSAAGKTNSGSGVKMMKRLLFISILVLSAMLAAGPALADELEEQIKLGLKLYLDGKYNEAASELEFALAGLRQKKAEAMSRVLPEAPSGWKTAEPQAESAGRGFLGGGISAAREYTQKSGKGRAKIELMSDSPLVQSLGMMLNNPMFMQGSRQGKLVEVSGQKALLQQKRIGSAELQALVEGKVLIKVSVRAIESPSEMAMHLAGNLDMKKLRELAQ